MCLSYDGSFNQFLCPDLMFIMKVIDINFYTVLTCTGQWSWNEEMGRWITAHHNNDFAGPYLSSEAWGKFFINLCII